MTTIHCTMLSEPADGSFAGMASRVVGGCILTYGALSVTPVIPTAGVVAWRKTTAAGFQGTHHVDAPFATPVGSGGSG